MKRLATQLDVDHHIAQAVRRPVCRSRCRERALSEAHDVDWLRDALRRCRRRTWLGASLAPQSVCYAARKYGGPALVNGHDPPPAVAAALAEPPWLAGRRQAARRSPSWRPSSGTWNGWRRRCGRVAFRRCRSQQTRTWPQLRVDGSHRARPQVAGAGRSRVGCSRRTVRDTARRATMVSTASRPHTA